MVIIFKDLACFKSFGKFPGQRRGSPPVKEIFLTPELARFFRIISASLSLISLSLKTLKQKGQL